MSPAAQPAEVDVLVVGAGPNGVTAANLLAFHGVRVHVVEARAHPADEPRAIALSDESLRVAHGLGVLDGLRPDLVWTSGSCYYGARGQLIARTQPAAARQGFPVKTLFDQPGYVRAHLDRMTRRDLVTIEYQAAVDAVDQDAEGVDVTIQTPDGPRGLRARFVLACDGGRSTIRQSLGIEMTGSSQTHPWIVVDTIDDPRDDGDTEFHCDPRRPHVIVPGTQGRCRYEFMLLRGEDEATVLHPAFIERLLAPYRSLRPGDVRRSAVYVAHQLVASRWRKGRIFLAGDAAHLMPPFAGQGLNTGVRDVHNLAWKIAAVLQGRGTDALLDTYETERRPHAVAMMELSSRIGKIVMTSSPVRARLRDAAFEALRVVPPARRHLTELRFLPRPNIAAGAAAVLEGPPPGTAAVPPLVGSPLPQGTVIDPFGTVGLLDDVLGDGWALIALFQRQDEGGAAFPSEVVDLVGARPVLLLPRGRIPRSHDGMTTVAEQQPVLQVPVAHPPDRPRLLLVRPDRYVAADFSPSQAAEVRRQLRPFMAPVELAGRTAAP